MVILEDVWRFRTASKGNGDGHGTKTLSFTVITNNISKYRNIVTSTVNFCIYHGKSSK